MSNSFISAQQIARAALPMLKNNLVFPLLTYTDYAEEFASFGDTIQVKKPPVYEAKEFSGAIVPQDVAEDRVLVTMDKIADVSVEIGAKEMALNLESFETQVIEPAAIAIAEKINSDGLQLYKDVPYFAGTAGTTPAALDDFAAARKQLNLRKAPLFPRYGVWDPEADTKFSVLPAIVNAEKSGSTEALREGAIGRVQGLDNYMSQAVCRHTAGAVSAGSLLPKAAHSVGDTTVTFKDGSSLAGSVKAGDILTFTVGGVAYPYTVTADAAVAGNELAVSIYPALKTALATTDEATLIASHTANLVFHKNAFAFVSRPLELARGVESYVTAFEGLTLRVTFGYDVAAKKQMLSIDTLYGFKTIYPELACRILG